MSGSNLRPSQGNTLLWSGGRSAAQPRACGRHTCGATLGPARGRTSQHLEHCPEHPSGMHGLLLFLPHLHATTAQLLGPHCTDASTASQTPFNGQHQPAPGTLPRASQRHSLPQQTRAMGPLLRPWPGPGPPSPCSGPVLGSSCSVSVPVPPPPRRPSLISSSGVSFSSHPWRAGSKLNWTTVCSDQGMVLRLWPGPGQSLPSLAQSLLHPCSAPRTIHERQAHAPTT